MSRAAGRRIALSPPRRVLCDMLHFARHIPSVPVQRRMALAKVVAARAAVAERPSWCAIFTQALALVPAIRPELRRSFLSFPWPHLYEHAESVANVAIERRCGDEDTVFFVPLPNPEAKSLVEIDAKLRRYKEAPLS